MFRGPTELMARLAGVTSHSRENVRQRTCSDATTNAFTRKNPSSNYPHPSKSISTRTQLMMNHRRLQVLVIFREFRRRRESLVNKFLSWIAQSKINPTLISDTVHLLAWYLNWCLHKNLKMISLFFIFRSWTTSPSSETSSPNAKKSGKKKARRTQAQERKRRKAILSEKENIVSPLLCLLFKTQPRKTFGTLKAENSYSFALSRFSKIKQS